MGPWFISYRTLQGIQRMKPRSIHIFFVFSINTLLIFYGSVAHGSHMHSQLLDPDPSLPCPFTRVLSYSPSAPQSGNDVIIAQTLLSRTSVLRINVTGTFDEASFVAVKTFQKLNKILPTGILDGPTASLLLELNSADGWQDPEGALPVPPGLLYKLWVPVHANRSIEPIATLFAANGTVLHRFTVRLQGNPGRGQFCSNGDTPTGYGYFDLNSPEDDPKSFGPYPVNRVAWGLQGNQALLLTDATTTPRNGILMHTGEWEGWQPGDPMPHSDGCIHGYPEDIKKVWKILVSIGVVVRDNPWGERPYPYKPQGVISITLAP